jgi:SAM-dependent methyltransferase
MDKEQYDILFRLEECHWWYLGMREIVASLLTRYVDNGKPLRILDAGCGTGGMTKYLNRFGRAFGVDMAPEAIAGSQLRKLTTVARASVEQLPFVAETFDLVVTFDVLYHQDVVNDAAALSEFHRVLRPGGMLVVRVPAYNWLRGAHDVAVHTRHRYSRAELGQKLADAGFAARKLTYANSLLFPIAALKRLAEGTRGTIRMDLELPSPAINRLLLAALRLESALLPAVSFPWGLSVMAVATKVVRDQPPASSDQPSDGTDQAAGASLVQVQPPSAMASIGTAARSRDTVPKADS